MNQGQLIHIEGNFLFVIPEGQTQAETIEALKAEEYVMGRTSLSNLLSGKVEKACGFIFEPAKEEAPAAPQVVFLTDASQLKVDHGQSILNTLGGIIQARENVGKSIFHTTPKSKNTQSRNKREGGYCFRHCRAGKSGISMKAQKRINKLAYKFKDDWSAMTNAEYVKQWDVIVKAQLAQA